MAVTDHLERPTRGLPLAFAPGWSVWVTPRRLFGLAPTGGCRAPLLTLGAVGSYPTVSPLPWLALRLPRAVCFLWPSPSPRGAQALPGSLPFGARTFLGGIRTSATIASYPRVKNRSPGTPRPVSRVLVQGRPPFDEMVVEGPLRVAGQVAADPPPTVPMSTVVHSRDRRTQSAAGPTVAAVVAPAERASLDAASIGCFAVLHRNSVPEAVRTVRENAVDAVLLSVRQCAEERTDIVDQLVRGFPGVPTVALVTGHDSTVSETLLRLGATGVRQVVDVTAASGWARLRQLVAEPASRAAARILSPVFHALPGLPPDARIYLELLIRVAPDTTAVRTLARRFQLKPSTMMSRFSRAGLPSPKTYLAAIRLLYAAQYFEGGGRSVSDVAYRLDCSSPQSFGRTLRAMLGITPGEFRRRFPFPAALERFLSQLVSPYQSIWARFHPLRGTPRSTLEHLA
jgi:AraC-like DNA-binding protein